MGVTAANDERQEVNTGPSTPIEIVIETKIAKEIVELRTRLDEIDTKAFDLQVLCEEAERKAEQSGKPEDLAEYQSLHRQLISYINAGITFSEKIQTLRQPSELGRRVNEALANQESLRRLLMTETQTETAKPKKPTPLEQGVPEIYLNEDGSKFRTGMDARLKSDLIESIVGGITKDKPGNSLVVFDEKSAMAILEARDWTDFLVRKQALLGEKAEKKAKAETARAEAAEAKAKEKAAKAEAAKAEKAAKAETAAEGKTSSSKGSSSKTDQLRKQREEQAAAAGSK